MGQVLVRNLDDNVIRRLKERAAANNHSLGEELRRILTQAAGMTMEEFRQKARKLREEIKKSGRTQTDSADLIREDRDR